VGLVGWLSFLELDDGFKDLRGFTKGRVDGEDVAFDFEVRGLDEVWVFLTKSDTDIVPILGDFDVTV